MPRLSLKRPFGATGLSFGKAGQVLAGPTAQDSFSMQESFFSENFFFPKKTHKKKRALCSEKRALCSEYMRFVGM